MKDEKKDRELEWLKRQMGQSNRTVGEKLGGVHHEIIRQARLTGNVGNVLRGKIRDYMEAHSEEGGEVRQEQSGSWEGTETSGAHQASNSAGTNGDAGTGAARVRDSPPRPRRRRRSLEERLAERERAARSDLLDEIVACETVQQIAGVMARIRARQLEDLYEKRQVRVTERHRPIPLTPYYMYPRAATPDELKTYAIALLLGIPVLKELPLDAAVSAANAVLDGSLSLLEPPPLVHGDAVVLLLTRAAAHYQDAGAREVALASADKRYRCGLHAEVLRDGVPIEWRLRRYACDDHRDRPLMIGVLFSDVILEIAPPDEDWRLGSTGWIDKEGVWKPSRAEVVALWRHTSSMHDDWRAGQPRTLWHDALVMEKASLEIILLSPEYGMTFDKDVLGEARWPTSTRLGHEMQTRLLRLEATDREKLRRRQILLAPFLWLPHLLLSGLNKLVFAARRDFAVYVEKCDRPKGSARRRELLSALLMRPMYDREHPPAKPPRIRETIMPALYEPVSEQRFPTRIVSWMLYRRHSDLDGTVCGLSDWSAADPPMTPAYMTPNPASGYVPSRPYRLRFRPHEFEPGYRAPAPREQSRRWLAKAIRGVGRLVGRRIAG